MISSDKKNIITFHTAIRKSDDHLYKINILNQFVDQIEDQDHQFQAMIQNVIVGEEQDGEWANSMEESTNKFTKKAELITADLKDEIKRSVITYDQQVEQMKQQEVTITYTQNGSAF